MTIPYQVVALPAFADNYIWLVHDGSHACVIDPGTAPVVERYLDTHNLQLQAIIITHGHLDHVGGVAKLYTKYQPQIIDNLEFQLKEDQIITIPYFPSFKVMLTPGHTPEHVCYFFDDKHLFCGDVLFSMGCGRVFTNNFSLACTSLSKIKALSPQVLCYPAHEYTMDNLRFSENIDPNPDHYYWYRNKIVAKLDTLKNSLPILLKDELKYNLFLRCDDERLWPALQAKTGNTITDACEAFVALRTLRNGF